MSEAERSLECESFGVRFRLAAESETLLQALRERAPWGTTAATERAGKARVFAVRQHGGGYCVSAGGEALAARGDLSEALDDLAHALMLHVAEHAPGHVFVHAGVVAWRGRGLVLPGASFAGKTTLVAELVRAGATYYSDEFAVIDVDGRLHAYARPLGMRMPGKEQQTLLDVTALGGATGAEPMCASHVAFVEYANGAEWRPEPVSTGAAALEMLKHAVPVRRAPRPVMAALAKMLDGAVAVRSQRGPAKETAPILLAMMEGDRA